jgi:2-keto-4-pentenoate hydratase/2-oxohepta-3-ene-1,7-dioic acid hydratase in catechol pathway
LKFVCYREFNDPEEPIYPGVLYDGKTLPLARLVAVAEALHPQGLTVPEDLDAILSVLDRFPMAVKELERAKVLDKIWQEIGVTPAAPVPRPRRILAIGRNYAEHAKEQNLDVPTEPVVFLKPSSSVIGPEMPIVIPPGVGRVDHEGELAVVIGRPGRRISEREALSYVAGYTLINDVTAREQKNRDAAHGLPWFLSKGYDTFCPMGPCLVTADEIRNPATLEITVTVNGEVRQHAKTADMLFPVPRLIAYLSEKISLEAGDVIATGTPSGISALNPGDTVEVTIPQIGTLTNPVIAEEDL